MGVSQLEETVQTVKKFYNANLQVMGLLLTKYYGRTNLAKEVQEMANEIASQLDTAVFQSKIRSSISVAEAPAHGESVILYAPRSKPTLDYINFIEEVLIRCKSSAKTK
ncbi:Sporulation initiation inhibitor protein Soj [bioreactor metagenome]|uniref:Sporulation initiation inhibitor protein Soj n=1 Tax=bioreactor metagenome TaxID=1076179 RepID=A0A645HXM9_9ZZZZ